MPAVSLRGVVKRFRVGSGGLTVLDGLDLQVRQGEFVGLVGPSGCGKSTLLHVVAGLEEPSAGSIEVDGSCERLGRVALMPQKDLLLPWKRAVDNAALGLRSAGLDGRQAAREAAGYFPLFGLAGFERSYPSTLSGGERQRVALLRTFLAGRRVVALDEPLGALDWITRRSLHRWLLHAWQRFDAAILLVTHDVDEALLLSDRVYVLTPRPARVADEVGIEAPQSEREGYLASQEGVTLRNRILRALGLRDGQGVPS
ncbi:ABC transporter [Limnochorda pilosa]|uniref:ABC transporter n=1 Tax=Limnochorda pilosa TaxID=1555112 RepID=A0A0K2SLB2_LIMPI|nr:ABC transporter [Limnochorda pilosa]